MGLAAVMGLVGIDAPLGVGIALWCIFRELDPLTFILGGRPVWGINPKHNGRFALIGGIKFGKHGCVRAGMNDSEGQAKGLDAFIVKAFPSYRATDIAALG